MRTITIPPGYQITIPKEIRERFTIKPGDKAMFIPHGKTIEVVFLHSNEEEERLHSKTSEFSENSEV